MSEERTEQVVDRADHERAVGPHGRWVTDDHGADLPAETGRPCRHIVRDAEVVLVTGCSGERLLFCHADAEKKRLWLITLPSVYAVE